MAFWRFFLNFSRDVGPLLLQVLENQPRTGSDALSGAKHRPPFVRINLLDEKNFHGPARVWLFRAQTRTQDLGVIHNQKVRFPEVRPKIGEILMADRLGNAIQH